MARLLGKILSDGSPRPASALCLGRLSVYRVSGVMLTVRSVSGFIKVLGQEGLGCRVKGLRLYKV